MHEQQERHSDGSPDELIAVALERRFQEGKLVGYLEALQDTICDLQERYENVRDRSSIEASR